MKELIDHGVENQFEIEITRDQAAVDLVTNDQAVPNELKMVWLVLSLEKFHQVITLYYMFKKQNKLID